MKKPPITANERRKCYCHFNDYGDEVVAGIYFNISAEFSLWQYLNFHSAEGGGGTRDWFLLGGHQTAAFHCVSYSNQAAQHPSLGCSLTHLHEKQIYKLE